jgi:hypothetical protein
VTAVTINRLTQHEVGTLIDRVVANKLLLGSIRQDILDRSDGIPLFAEEITKAVLEAQSESEARQTVAAVPSCSWRSPNPAHDWASPGGHLDAAYGGHRGKPSTP